MLLHPDRGAAGAPSIRNGCVIHDSEGQEGTLPWGQFASAQLVEFLGRPGDRISSSGRTYGSGYSAVARENGDYTTVADDNIGPYHCGAGFNPYWWSVCIPGKAKQTRTEWLNDVSRFYIRGAARYTVDRWNHDGRRWPLEFITGPELRLLQSNLRDRPSGYTSHAQVTVSKLTSTDHSDPGISFPWDVFHADCMEFANPTTPTPIPGDDDMAIGIITLTDADAQFIGHYTGEDTFLELDWINNPRAVAARDLHISKGAKVFSHWNSTNLGACWVNEIPHGDSRVDWTDGHFAGIG